MPPPLQETNAVIEHADGLPLPQRRWAILTIALGIVMAVVDGAIANVALPTIAKDLDASPAFSIWIVNGYQLAITISLLPLAALGEIIGYRRVYLAGLVLFTLASVFCALSHTLPGLTVARIVQGFGAAGIMSVNSALVRFTYPRALLGRGIGLNAMVVAVSAAVGSTCCAFPSSRCRSRLRLLRSAARCWPSPRSPSISKAGSAIRPSKWVC